MPEEILSRFEQTNNRFWNALSYLDQQALNTVPFEGSWTAGQVAEHVLKSQQLVTKVIYGTTKSTQRNPEEKKEIIEQIFLDFSTKLKSPEIILPSDEMLSLADIDAGLKQECTRITEAIRNFNLSDTCTDFALPGIGEFTRMEWVYFIIYHKERHIHQLENICRNLPVEITA